VRGLLPLLAVLVAGCSSPMPTVQGAGALADGQVVGGILRIAVPRGNLPNCASPDECTLVRAAEATQRAGGTHFMVLPGHGGKTQAGYAYVRIFTFGAGEEAPSSAMSVEEVLYFYRRPQGQPAS
jgi:hypothetical protein